MMTDGLRTWIEVDKVAIQDNFNIFRSHIDSGTALGAVVKSNAYGHDFRQFSQEVINCGIDWLIVDSIVEALALRKEGISIPILVLGYTLPERISQAAEKGISITVSTFDLLEAVIQEMEKGGVAPKIHIKVDTGMTRHGFFEKDRDLLLKTLKKHKGELHIEGLFTHFSAAKNPVLPHFTNTQIERFTEWKNAFEDGGFSPLCHTAATGGALLFPESHFDLVRIGIGMYGLWPSQEAKAHLEEDLTLTPALSWKTIVGEVKNVPVGTRVGYDGTEVLSHDATLAICPVGYWHGFSRKLSGIGHVLIRGKRARVVGRVSMDIITVDVTDIPGTSMGDEVVLIGEQGDEKITAYEMASLDDTSWYETITRINPLIKRIYV
ncbi:MAG: alanine racemase [Candidatus Paceibacterota bacterium]